VRGCEVDSYESGKVPVIASCEHGNESSGSIKKREISLLTE
jgi:hypothetical protein